MQQNQNKSKFYWHWEKLGFKYCYFGRPDKIAEGPQCHQSIDKWQIMPTANFFTTSY